MHCSICIGRKQEQAQQQKQLMVINNNITLFMCSSSSSSSTILFNECQQENGYLALATYLVPKVSLSLNLMKKIREI